MTQNHTPGPWHTHPANVATIDGFKVHRIPISGGGQAIAAVWNGSVGKEYLSDDAGLANAALIARAPDLLAENERLRAALETVDALLERTIFDCDPPVNFTAEAQDVVRIALARAALARSGV